MDYNPIISILSFYRIVRLSKDNIHFIKMKNEKIEYNK